VRHLILSWTFVDHLRVFLSRDVLCMSLRLFVRSLRLKLKCPGFVVPCAFVQYTYILYLNLGGRRPDDLSIFGVSFDSVSFVEELPLPPSTFHVSVYVFGDSSIWAALHMPCGMTASHSSDYSLLPTLDPHDSGLVKCAQNYAQQVLDEKLIRARKWETTVVR